MPLASLRRSPSDEAVGGSERPGWGNEDKRFRPARTRAGAEGRRPVLAAFGVLVVVGCAALGADVAARVDHRATYLAVAAYVAEGSVIVPEDLAIVSMTSASGLAAIPSADKPSVLGRRASEPLEPGSLLVPDDLSGARPLPHGAALVGTSLSTNQMPAGLTPGASVIVVLSAPSAGSTASVVGSTSNDEGELAVGTVYAVVLPSPSEAVASDDEIVTLEVPRSAAAAVTAASAAGNVSLAEISTQAQISTQRQS